MPLDNRLACDDVGKGDDVDALLRSGKALKTRLRLRKYNTIFLNNHKNFINICGKL